MHGLSLYTRVVLYTSSYKYHRDEYYLPLKPLTLCRVYKWIPSYQFI